MDADSLRHLDEWLTREYGKRKTTTMIAVYRARMVALISREPQWLGRRWDRIWEAAR